MSPLCKATGFGVGLLLLCSACPAQMVPVLTRAYDNERSGANLQETILTQASVKAKGVRRVTIIPVFGDARGLEAQPLVRQAHSASTLWIHRLAQVLRRLVRLACTGASGSASWAGGTASAR